MKFLKFSVVVILAFILVGCKKEHTHNFIDGVCECGDIDPNYVPPHEHEFVEGKCECGEVDPNYVPPHKHVFVEGKCECGEVDPNYVAPVYFTVTFTDIYGNILITFSLSIVICFAYLHLRVLQTILQAYP